jgi:hypothetical protein
VIYTKIAERYHIVALGDPQSRIENIEEFVPDFRCTGLDVVEVLAPESDVNFEGGTLLAMPESCRNELKKTLANDVLMKQAKFKLELSDFKPNCYTYQSRIFSKELCFEGKVVYFGSVRVG